MVDMDKTPGEQAAAIAMARSLNITILGERPPVRPPVDLATLEAAIEQSWSAQTSYYANWTPQNPAYGQCAVTALIVQDHLGGDLVRQVITPGQAHFWNQLKDGTKVDLTERQFALAPAIREPATTSPVRQRLLAYLPTAARYQLLKAAVEKNLAEMVVPEVVRELAVG
jgi:hypothetical protein